MVSRYYTLKKLLLHGISRQLESQLKDLGVPKKGVVGRCVGQGCEVVHVWLSVPFFGATI